MFSQKFQNLVQILSLPKILIETAAMIYRNYEKNKEAKGKSVSCISAGYNLFSMQKVFDCQFLDVKLLEVTGILSND